MMKEINIWFGKTYIGRQLMVPKDTCGPEQYVVFEKESFTVHEDKCSGPYINLQEGRK
jgi:hypothetical protein